MLKNIVLLAAIIAMSPAQQAGGDLDGVLPDVKKAVKRAIVDQIDRSVQGPMYLDVDSFRAAASRSGISLDSSGVARAWGGPSATKNTAIEGDYAELAEQGRLHGEPQGMWIKDKGVLVEIDEVQVVDAGYDLTVSYSYTSDRKFRDLPVLGGATLRLEFRYLSGKKLRLDDSVVLGVS